MNAPLPFSPHLVPPPRTARDVRELRAKLDLTQAQFGAVLGLHRSTIIRYEAGSEIGLLEQWALQGLAIAAEQYLLLDAIDKATKYFECLRADQES